MSQLKYLILKAKAKITKDGGDEWLLHMYKKNMDLINKVKASGIPLSQSPEILPLLFSKDSPLELLKLFVSSGIDINIKDKNGNSLLMQQPYNVNSTKYLISKGIDINAVNNDGENAFFMADLDNKKLLLEHGVNKNQINKKGENALFKSLGNSDYIKFLLENGVRSDILNNNGDSIISLNPQIIDMLTKEQLNKIVKLKPGNEIFNDVVFTLIANSIKGSALNDIETIKKKMEIDNTDWFMIDSKGNNLYSICFTKDILSFLNHKGVSLNIKNKDNESMFDLIMKRHNSDPLFIEKLKEIKVIHDLRELNEVLPFDVNIAKDAKQKKRL